MSTKNQTYWHSWDNNAYTHPKLLSVSVTARWLLFASVGYAANYLTDGKLPWAAVRSLPDFSEDAAQELIRGRLWELEGEGIAIHDYLDHQTSREEVQKVREAWRARKQRSREKQAAVVDTTSDASQVDDNDVTRDMGVTSRVMSRNGHADVTPLQQQQQQQQQDSQLAPSSLAVLGSKRARTPRDDVWDAMVECFGQPITPDEKKVYGQWVTKYTERGITAEQMVEWRRRWPNVKGSEPATPGKLLRSLGQVLTSPDTNGRSNGRVVTEYENRRLNLNHSIPVGKPAPKYGPPPDYTAPRGGSP